MKDQLRAAALSVCDLLKHVDTYDGKIVSVRGQYLAMRHEPYFGDPGCTLRLGGRQWPAGILLVKSGSNIKNQSANFATDEDAIKRAFKMLSFLDGTTTSELGVTITMTITGQLRSARLRDESKPKHLLGYGVMLNLPAEIVLTTIKDNEVRQIR